ncbi:hypothetical protein ACE1CD_12565 [Aerosakkonema sp. BLCC-F183]
MANLKSEILSKYALASMARGIKNATFFPHPSGNSASRTIHL